MTRRGTTPSVSNLTRRAFLQRAGLGGATLLNGSMWSTLTASAAARVVPQTLPSTT